MNRTITLTTDFGLADGYVGTMKGVILAINPQATLVDITHEIAPQDIEEGAFLFAISARYFPDGTVHLVVVDPGVGSARRPIAIQVGATVFVAPDNGVLTPAVQAWSANRGEPIRAVHLNEHKFWLPDVSRTFHGRDIFAPCAAHLSLGTPLVEMGEPVEDWARLPSAEPQIGPDGAITARVTHIDRFGNVITNLCGKMVEDVDPNLVVITIGTHRIAGLRSTYSDVKPGQIVALVGSSGCLELAVRDGSAASTLGVRKGALVLLSP